MRPDDITRIRHMIEAAEAAARFLAGKSRENLDSDIDRDIVWKTAVEEIPPLRLQLLSLLPAT